MAGTDRTDGAAVKRHPDEPVAAGAMRPAPGSPSSLLLGVAGSAATGPSGLGSTAELAASPERFDFFAALRLLERAHDDRPRLGKAKRATDEAVRLGQVPQLAFPTSSLAGFTPAEDGRPAKLAVLLMGLFGSNGPLPLHLAVWALERQRHAADTTFLDFCDILHHRPLALFYRAWADARPHVQHDRPEADRFRLYLGALIGLGLPSLQHRDSVPDRFKLRHAGLIGCRVAHPERLSVTLRNLLRVPVGVVEFVGGWLELPERLRSRLGRTGARLGVDAVVGIASFQRQHRFRIRLGPLGLAAFMALLPDGPLHRRLRDLVRLLVGDALEWDLELVLRAEEVPGLRLDGAARLGWTSWLPVAGTRADAADLVLRPCRATA